MSLSGELLLSTDLRETLRRTCPSDIRLSLSAYSESIETSQVSTMPSVTLRPSSCPRSMNRRTVRGLTPRDLAAWSVVVQPDSLVVCPSPSVGGVHCGGS